MLPRADMESAPTDRQACPLLGGNFNHAILLFLFLTPARKARPNPVGLSSMSASNWLPLRTDSPDTGEVAQSARRGALSPKVTEGWLLQPRTFQADAIALHPSHPPPPAAELPSRGAFIQGGPP